MLLAALGIVTVSGLIASKLDVKVYASAMLLALLLFPALFVSRYFDQRTHAQGLRSQAQQNIAGVPAGFHTPHYMSAAVLPRDRNYALYDVETCQHLGNVPGSQLCDVIRAHEDWGLGTNDFFIMPETLDGRQRRSPGSLDASQAFR